MYLMQNVWLKCNDVKTRKHNSKSSYINYTIKICQSSKF